jgi:hypothetical protein
VARYLAGVLPAAPGKQTLTRKQVSHNERRGDRFQDSKELGKNYFCLSFRVAADRLPFVLAFLPKVHGGTHTLWALDLLGGVSKQPVAGIHAEGHLTALNDAAYSRRRG